MLERVPTPRSAHPEGVRSPGDRAPGRRVRVCHVITGLGTGGAELVLARLVAASDPARFEHRVCALGPPGPVAEVLAALGVEVTCLGMSGGAGDLGRMGALVRYLRAARPDLVQTWMYHGDLAGTLAAALARVGPVVWNIRHTDTETVSGARTRLVLRACSLLSRLPRAIVVCSRAALQSHQAAGYRAERMTLIPNGFDTARFQPDPGARARLAALLGLAGEAPLVGSVARLHPDKDHGTLMAALRMVAARQPNAHFVLVGDQVVPGHPFFREALDGPWGERVHLLGRRDDVAGLLPGLDVFVQSSRTEGFPNAVGEAMASGVPCVVTDVGDSALLLGDCGRVVRAEDGGALAEGICQLLEMTPAARGALGAAARLRIEAEYDLPGMVRRYQALYLTLAGEAALPTGR